MEFFRMLSLKLREIMELFMMLSLKFREITDIVAGYFRDIMEPFRISPEFRDIIFFCFWRTSMFSEIPENHSTCTHKLAS